MVSGITPLQDIILVDGVTSHEITLDIRNIDPTQVVVWTEDRTEETEKTPLVEDTDYTFHLDSAGLTYLDLITPFTAGHHLIIYSNLAYGQNTDYIEGDAMNPEVLERDLDRLHILGIQGANQRAIRAPANDGEDSDLIPQDYILPLAEERKGMLLKFHPETGAPTLTEAAGRLRWNGTDIYNSGELVELGGILYQCTATTSEDVNPTLLTDWEVFDPDTVLTEISNPGDFTANPTTAKTLIYGTADTANPTKTITLGVGTLLNQMITIIADIEDPALHWVKIVTTKSGDIYTQKSVTIIWDGTDWILSGHLDQSKNIRWNPKASYLINDIVEYGGSLYESTTAGTPLDVTPAVGTNDWTPFTRTSDDTVNNEDFTVTLVPGIDKTIYCDTSTLAVTITLSQDEADLLPGHLVHIIQMYGNDINIIGTGISTTISSSATVIWNGSAWYMQSSTGASGSSGAGSLDWDPTHAYVAQDIALEGGVFYKLIVPNVTISDPPEDTPAPSITPGEWFSYQSREYQTIDSSQTITARYQDETFFVSGDYTLTINSTTRVGALLHIVNLGAYNMTITASGLTSFTTTYSTSIIWTGSKWVHLTNEQKLDTQFSDHIDDDYTPLETKVDGWYSGNDADVIDQLETDVRNTSTGLLKRTDDIEKWVSPTGGTSGGEGRLLAIETLISTLELDQMLAPLHDTNPNGTYIRDIYGHLTMFGEFELESHWIYLPQTFTGYIMWPKQFTYLQSITYSFTIVILDPDYEERMEVEGTEIIIETSNLTTTGLSYSIYCPRALFEHLDAKIKWISNGY